MRNWSYAIAGLALAALFLSGCASNPAGAKRIFQGGQESVLVEENDNAPAVRNTTVCCQPE